MHTIFYTNNINPTQVNQDRMILTDLKANFQQIFIKFGQHDCSKQS